MAQAFDDGHPRRLPAALASAPPGARVPPHNLEAEESLLGAMLLSPDAVTAAVGICSASDFYKPAHGHIFAAVRSLFEVGEPVDVVTVTDELRRSALLEAVGDPSLLVSLQAGTPSTANAIHYAKIVEEHSLLRRLVGVAGDIAELGYSAPDDVVGTLDRAETMVFEVAQRKAEDTVRPLGDLLSPALDHIQQRHEQGDIVTGVATGFVDLDEMLAGLQPSSLTIVGARPSMGKTSLALGMVAHVGVVLQRPVLLVSLEMGHLELTQRLLAAEALVDAHRLRIGRLHEQDWPRISQAISRLSDAPVYIDDNPNATVMDIRARARRLRKSAGDLGLVVVDYLQLMTGGSRARFENRQVEVADISRGLKILARELDVPVVALSQLSRNLEARQDKRPMLSDLRESGSLEQDADVVLFIYREEAYDLDAPVDRRGRAEVIVAKHRNGRVGMIELVFRNQYARFDNMARV
jgi:replicative DNA helicase